MKVKKIPFKQFKKIYSKVPRLCVEVVLRERKGLLLIRRTIKPSKGEWHTPGGTVLKGETLEEAVKRVAFEELGIKVKIQKIIGIIEYKSYRNHYSQDISVAFLVKNLSPKNKFKLDGRADKYDFFSVLPPDTIKDQKSFYSKHLLL